MNPLNASNQTFGCHGATPTEHIVVYWIGPMIATSVGAKMHHTWITAADIHHKNN